MELTEYRTVVLDHGSDKIKAGFAGSDVPAVIMRSVVGRPKDRAVESSAGSVCFGEEAISNKDKRILKFPIEWCTTVNWKETEMLWQHVFEKLDAAVSENPLLVSEPPTNPKLNREKTVELAFETFGVPAFGMTSAAAQAVLAMHQQTGLVVDLGEGPMRVMPVHEGYFLPSSYYRCQVDGAHVTQALKNFMCEQNPSAQELPWETVKDIKEKFAYVAHDFEQEIKTHDNTLKAANTVSVLEQKNVCQLPSGETVTLGKELFQCAEVLFKPSLLGIEMMGVAEHISYTISKSAEEIQPDLAINIVLTGGGAKFPGISDRILCDVKQHLGEKGYAHLNVNVISPKNPETLVWRGGSLMASTSAATKIMMAKEEYDDCGPSAIHKKCF